MLSILLPTWQEMYRYRAGEFIHIHTAFHIQANLNTGEYYCASAAWHLAPSCSMFCEILANVQIPTGDSSGWDTWEYIKPPFTSTYFSVVRFNVFTFIVTL